MTTMRLDPDKVRRALDLSLLPNTVLRSWRRVSLPTVSKAVRGEPVSYSKALPIIKALERTPDVPGIEDFLS
jgi:hypothetical protein